MITLTIASTKEVDEVREQLDDTFGAGGLGLRSDSFGGMIAYTGGGGFVTAIVRRDDGQTVIDLSTQEYEDTVWRFAREAA